VKNEGQADPRVAYYVQGSATSVYLTRDALVLTLSKRAERERLCSAKPGVPRETGRWTVRLSFEGANPHARVTGQDRTTAAVSYFTGDRSQWKTGLATYASVVYEELWPGIDLVYGGSDGRLKYTFLVKPGADPARIRLRYEGATAVSPSGARLRVETPLGGFEEEAPYAYQGDGDARAEVAASFEPEEGAPAGSYRFGFRVGAYDRTKLLVLDPVVLTYCGFIGGSGLDDAYGLAVDGSGNAYVVGRTQSAAATFPETVGPDLSHNGGTDDAFVAKVNAAGTALVYCGYIGGANFDIAYEVAVDGSGAAYVAGTTTSPQTSFPVLVGPDTTLNNGAGTPDAFVAKVDPGGASLVYCGYIGGADEDEAYALAIDGAGSAYVTGRTNSASGFPASGPGDLTWTAATTSTWRR